METLLPVLAAVIPIAGIVVLIVIANNSAAARERARTTARLAAVERKLDLLLSHLELEEPEFEHPEILEHLRRGRKINAIKLYREHTGADLAEAKLTVERIAAEHGL